jgi:hypothetical protein
MKYQILWAHPSENKPSVLENVTLTKDVIAQLEQQYADKIISIKPVH